MERVKLPVYRATVGDVDPTTGILAVSFVDDPAIERNFVALKKQEERVLLKIDRQKQVLTGALLVPDQHIYRRDPDGEEYYLTFTREEIEKIAAKMMRRGISLNKTSHQHKRALDGNYLTELWLIQDPKRDKSAALGLKDLPAGTLCVSYKVQDKAYWQSEVLAGKVKGFSLEGIFNTKIVRMGTTKTNTPPVKGGGRVDSLLARFKALLEGDKVECTLAKVRALLEGDTAGDAAAVADEAKKDETGSGTPVLIFELAEGGEAWVDGDGYCTLDGGEALPPGEHPLADGNVLVVDEAGVMVSTQPEADGAEPKEADVAMARQTGKLFLQAMAEARKTGGKPGAETAARKTGGKPGAEIAAKKDTTAVEIAKLRAQIAELEKQPSTTPAQPTVGRAANEGSTSQLADVLRLQRERMDRGKKQ